MRAIVVGAGAVGLMCALRLAQRGADVVVIESEEGGLGAGRTRAASRAAAGMLAPLSETAPEPAHVHPRLLELGLASLDLWRDLGARLALSTFPARGAVWLGAPETLEPMEALARAYGRAAARIGDGELHLPEEAALDPGEALAALERALAAEGGRVRRGQAVLRAGTREVVLANGDREAGDVVVLATGLGRPDLAGPGAPALTPAKGQILEVEADAPTPGAVLRGADIYAVGRAPGRVVIGATMEFGRDDLATEAGPLAALAARAGVLHPALKGAKRLRAWAGVRPMSADWAPRIGWWNGVIVARGHSRNGWLLAPITAEKVCADVFAEAAPALWTSFAP